MNNPNNGFISTVWGPALWLVLHCTALNYPLRPTAKDRRHYKLWFEGLGHVLPCGTCRTNFKENLTTIGYNPKIHFRSRMMLSYLLFKLHNNVRIMQGKPIIMTYMDSVLMYERFRAKDCTPNTASGEGGCFVKKPLVCTLSITPGRSDHCRYNVDPLCGINIHRDPTPRGTILGKPTLDTH
jgi:hypothetical protein